MKIALQKNHLGVKFGTEVWTLLKKRRQAENFDFFQSFF